MAERPRVSEARLAETEAGLRPEGEGWFVVNLADAAAVNTDVAGHAWSFEGEPPFPHFGINVHVLAPGEPASKYHAESNQEAFLVLDGECLLIVEDEERPLRRWDFVHLAPWTPHVLVGAGERPCAVLLVGARMPGQEMTYPVNEPAARFGAGVERETSVPQEAYADWHPPEPARMPWPPARD